MYTKLFGVRFSNGENKQKKDWFSNGKSSKTISNVTKQIIYIEMLWLIFLFEN
jgi:hypothetical protein